MIPAISRPSTLLGRIKVEKVDKFNLFKFTDELQKRMEELLERKKGFFRTCYAKYEFIYPTTHINKGFYCF
jgi:hypothetical protein